MYEKIFQIGLFLARRKKVVAKWKHLTDAGRVSNRRSVDDFVELDESDFADTIGFHKAEKCFGVVDGRFEYGFVIDIGPSKDGFPEEIRHDFPLARLQLPANRTGVRVGVGDEAEGVANHIPGGKKI